jgi:hypothetical protein
MLAHKTIDVRPELWRQARINAELSGVPLRDYISYLLTVCEPVGKDETARRAILDDQVRLNREARQAAGRKD